MESVLFEQYQNGLSQELAKDLGIKNPMEIPRIKKISINAGIGSYLQKLGSKNTDYVVDCMSKIAGQRPVINKAKMSVSNFKVREGMPVGVSVTLRKEEAYNFLYKMINLVYPRVRDFRGVTGKVFDKSGNCTVGFKDHTVFMEIDKPEDSRKVFGLQVSIEISGDNPENSRKLLEKFGFPFKKKFNQ